MTIITRHGDPFRELAGLQERMNRLFDETFTRTKGREEPYGAALWAPAVDIGETATEIVVKAELPGVPKEGVAVEIKEGVLTLSGERKFEKEVKEENYHRIERSYGRFLRSFALPNMIDAESVAASMKDGVLTIRVPKRTAATPKKVAIE